MKVGLIDVGGHTEIKKWGSAFPNLALMKLSAWHKKQGDEVEWAVGTDGYSEPPEYDVLYASKVFTSAADVDFSKYRYKKLEKGGTGYDLYKVLPDEIDRMQPDYSIYPFIDNKTAYGKLTLGCNRACSFCCVSKKEGKIRPYMDVEEIAVDGRKNLILLDNNILAAGDYAVEQLEKIIRGGYKVDFNQAMDARLVTPEYARLLAKVKWFPYIRFGCDTHGQIEPCERAIALLKENGWHGQVFLYCIITDDFEESVERVMYWRDKLVNGEKTYPHVQPYLDFTDASYQPPKWQKDMARWSGVVSLKKTFPVMEYVPRKGFVFSMYRDYPELRQCKTKEDIKAMMLARGIPAANVQPYTGKKCLKSGCAEVSTGTTARQLEIQWDW